MIGRFVKKGYRTGPPGWESITGLLKRFTNSGSVHGKVSDRNEWSLAFVDHAININKEDPIPSQLTQQ
jgi:hypothetical protein